MIHQKVNSILDRLYFKGNSQSMKTISKPDNYDKYDYNQTLSEKYMRQRQYTIFRSEVWA